MKEERRVTSIHSLGPFFKHYAVSTSGVHGPSLLPTSAALLSAQHRVQPHHTEQRMDPFFLSMRRPWQGT